MSELKTCPFCGGEAEIDIQDIDLNGSAIREEFQAYCINCDVQAHCFTEHEDAVNDWNTRAADEQLTTITKQRDELQKYLRHIHDYMLVRNKSYREGDLSAEVGTLLSTIKEQEDDK